MECPMRFPCIDIWNCMFKLPLCPFFLLFWRLTSLLSILSSMSFRHGNLSGTNCGYGHNATFVWPQVALVFSFKILPARSYCSPNIRYFGHTFPQLWSSSTVFMTTLVLNSRTGKQYYPVLFWKLQRQLVVFPVSVTFALYSVVSLNRCLGQTISLVASTSSQVIPARFKISSHSEITGSSPVNENVKDWTCENPSLDAVFSSHFVWYKLLSFDCVIFLNFRQTCCSYKKKPCFLPICPRP